jgi:glycosyltransferase involved in cell wall biosynthesis
VGIDGMQLWGEWTGIGRSIWEVARRLAADPRGHEYVLYASRGFKRKRELARAHFRVRRTWWSARNRTLRVFWQQLKLPFLASRELELLHAPAYVMPLMSLTPVVVTVHDTIALRHPELVRRSSVSHLKRFLPKTLDRARLVLVPSRAVADDLTALEGSLEREIPESEKRAPARPLAEKLRVVPFGVGEEFAPLEAAGREEARTRLGLRGPYVLFVGRVEPKKNVERAVEAFFAAVMARKLPHDLVLAGPARRTRSLDRLVKHLNIRDRVRRLGYVPDESLPPLYAAADLVLLPSKAEGFGFPVLEAMASGTPCVTSDDAALLELAGDAALAVDPERLDMLREAVERVLTEPETARQLREKGLARAREFTWERTVELTIAAYEEARGLFERWRSGPG